MSYPVGSEVTINKDMNVVDTDVPAGTHATVVANNSGFYKEIY